MPLDGVGSGEVAEAGEFGGEGHHHGAGCSGTMLGDADFGDAPGVGAVGVVGVLWAVWHAPLWFISGSPQSTMPFWLFFIALLAVRFIMGWAYNNTNGSLIIAVLFHLFFNFSNEFSVGTLGVPMNSFLYLATGALVICAVLVIIFAGPKNLSRKNERVMHQ